MAELAPVTNCHVFAVARKETINKSGTSGQSDRADKVYVRAVESRT